MVYFVFNMLLIVFTTSALCFLFAFILLKIDTNGAFIDKKRITIGDLILFIILSLIPVVNVGVCFLLTIGLLCNIGNLTPFLSKPLFSDKKDNE